VSLGVNVISEYIDAVSSLGTFKNNELVEVDIREWLRMQVPDFYRDGIFKLVPRWDKYINVPGDFVESNDTSVEYVSCI
jgi:hypothetical protein